MNMVHLLMDLRLFTAKDVNINSIPLGWAVMAAGLVS